MENNNEKNKKTPVKLNWGVRDSEVNNNSKEQGGGRNLVVLPSAQVALIVGHVKHVITASIVIQVVVVGFVNKYL